MRRLAAVVSGCLDYSGPILYGLRRWAAGSWHDPAAYEPDPIG